MAKNSNQNMNSEELIAMIYKKLLDLELNLKLLDLKVENLQEDISHNTYVRSELLKLRYAYKTNELYITKHFKVPFEGNEAVLLRHMFKKSSGLPKKSAKFYPAELAGKFEKETDGLKSAKSVHATINRIDATIKHRTKGLEIFKITTKVFYFL